MGEEYGEPAPEPLSADFASLAEVRRLAAELLERHERIRVLVNNAGVFMSRRVETPDGYETTFAVNHLAPFLLTNLLLDRLRASAPARIVTTSSGAHYDGHIRLDDLQGERSWSGWQAYSNSKLANVLFTRELARRLEGTEVTANCLHPGVIRTRLDRGASWPLRLGWGLVKGAFGSPRRGASTIVHLATSEEGGRISGAYFSGSLPRAPRAAPEGVEERLWEVSAELAGLA